MPILHLHSEIKSLHPNAWFNVNQVTLRTRLSNSLNYSTAACFLIVYSHTLECWIFSHWLVCSSELRVTVNPPFISSVVFLSSKMWAIRCLFSFTWKELLKFQCLHKPVHIFFFCPPTHSAGSNQSSLSCCIWPLSPKYPAFGDHLGMLQKASVLIGIWQRIAHGMMGSRQEGFCFMWLGYLVYINYQDI